MLERLKKLGLVFVLVACLSFMQFVSPFQVTAHAAVPVQIQLISDQESIGAGGDISYHIIYHNVQNKAVSHAWIKVIVPKGLEIPAIPGAVWNETSRTLQWHLKDIAAHGADVIHFNLKVKGDAVIGTRYDLLAQLGADGGISVNTPDCVVKVGTETHQPIFVGYPDGKFHPASSITRAETAAVLARIEHLTNNRPPAHPYTDVASSHWAYDYINEVTNAGYMQGDGAGHFEPDKPISRAEFVTLLLRIRGIAPYPMHMFKDTKGHWAKDEIGTAYALGYIQGKDNSSDFFAPDSSIHRDLAAKLLDIALYRGPLVDGNIRVIQHFPDVSRGDWSFGWIEEASTVAHESISKSNGMEYLIRYLPDQTEPF